MNGKSPVRRSPARWRTTLVVVLVIVVYATSRLGGRFLRSGWAILAMDVLALVLLVVLAWPWIRPSRDAGRGDRK